MQPFLKLGLPTRPPFPPLRVSSAMPSSRRGRRSFLSCPRRLFRPLLHLPRRARLSPARHTLLIIALITIRKCQMQSIGRLMTFFHRPKRSFKIAGMAAMRLSSPRRFPARAMRWSSAIILTSAFSCIRRSSLPRRNSIHAYRGGRYHKGNSKALSHFRGMALALPVCLVR